MPEGQDPAFLLMQNLEWIERFVSKLSRRNGLSPDERDDFASWVSTRLVDNDYAVLRKFRGDSAVTTFLTAVIGMLYRDFRVSRWGRWRPSAAAKRLGPIAVRLEMLVHRDGFSLAQAAEMLRSRGETNVSDRELARLLAELPPGGRRRPQEVGEELLSTAESDDAADALVHRSEDETEHAAVDAALARAMDGLPSEDRAILRMRFWQGISVADIARALRLEQKPLYRRLDRLYAILRKELERSDVSGDRVRGMLHGEGS
jgi:RNA polymerase sigma factor (sigma-70 family)